MSAPFWPLERMPEYLSSARSSHVARDLASMGTMWKKIRRNFEAKCLPYVG
jgi:hypothetical protein